ncbi:MAG: hypothetical protein B7Z80_14835 [Rhodospirillales bacterium 20-64-7]|nr:MAG: hypothetical protein B7Z80_14835 [Rhodospirillales bacterium 20-64-7]
MPLSALESWAERFPLSVQVLVPAQPLVPVQVSSAALAAALESVLARSNLRRRSIPTQACSRLAAAWSELGSCLAS